ncbi:MAG: hypothetical protein IKI59_05840 [Clostridia bacterium]|nr:hypothetical protein [Clostridia bacterium]
MKKKYYREPITGIIAIALSVLGVILFALGFSTGYYTYGQMNSGWITAAAACAIVLECAAIFCIGKFPKAWWPKLLTFCVTALLALAAFALIGDRVEGIGNCILTDYDSGHGGEEAIYFSLGGAVAWLVAMLFNIIGSFGKDEPIKTHSMCALYSVGIVLLVAILIPSLILGGVFAPKKTTASASAPSGANAGTVSGGEQASVAGTYSITLSGAEGNVEKVQDYQFQCGNLSGLMNYDTRLTLGLTLTLNEDGTYSLFSDAYCIEGGKRAVIGDDTGLGMISQMTAEGTYAIHDDGTVTTAPATHAVFELALDTYSSQMRAPASYKLGEDEMADGKYDSAEYPAVLDAVPETVWTLSGSEIVSYGKPAAGVGTYAITLSGAEGNVDLVQDYQFQCGNLGGLMNYDTRLTLDLSLTLNADGTYSIFSDAYCIEGGKRAVIGDDTGLGMISQMTAEGAWTANDDGTITTSQASHAVFELGLDTYSSQMRGPASYKIGEDEMADGKYDSAEYPAVLDAVPETVWTLSGSEIKAYAAAAADEPAEQPTEEPAEQPTAEGVAIPSDDGGTELTFYADGTYKFAFAAYSIEETGTYTYADGKLTVVNANGLEAVGEGDPIALHYVSATSDQLVGDYTIPTSTFDFGGGTEAAAVVIPSDDGGTAFTFRADGTAQFAFESYGIYEECTYTYEGGKLTVVNPNGLEAIGEGDPITLHYISAASDMLTGNYTIPASTFDFGTASASFEAFTILSDDEGTEITFRPDGTYRFWFAAYSVEDLGTFTFENGVLTLTDVNGVQYTGEGDPIHLHYGYSGAPDQLTGEYTIPAEKFGAASAASEPVTFISVDGGTEITFNGDGTYRFFFAAYNVEDLGIYTLDGDSLTVVNANGLEMTLTDGVLHYVSSMSDMLTGDFEIDVAKIG